MGKKEISFDKIYLNIMENYDIDEEHLSDILTTIEFRLNKNHYHYENIVNLCNENNIYENIEKIYYESENFIISMRSLLDHLLELTNFVYKLNLHELDITIKNITKKMKNNNALKNVFYAYASRNNKFWQFVYSTRNEIVHNVCIKTKFPISIADIYKNDSLLKKVYFENNGTKEDLLFYYKECLNLMDSFADKLLYVVSNNYR